MKVVTKKIANIIKHMLPEIIEEEQSAFVKETKGKCGVMDLKLDMSKAYDSLEWSFVTDVLNFMGFLAPLVNLIKNCISTVSYKVLINGQLSMSFSPEKGLQKGDPSLRLLIHFAC